MIGAIQRGGGETGGQRGAAEEDSSDTF